MKNNLVRFPSHLSRNPSRADFEKHHYVFEAPGRRIALDLFTRVTHLTRPTHPPKEPTQRPPLGPANQRRQR